MKLFQYFKISLILLLITSCKSEIQPEDASLISKTNSVDFATGLSIQAFENFTLIEVKNPWPNAKESFKYLAVKNQTNIPDSLSNIPQISVPLKSIIVSSTTHIPSLEMLGVGDKLKAFPNCDYISSQTMRTRINKGEIQELGPFNAMNMERILELQPNLFMAHGIDNNNPQLEQLKKSGISVLLNGDWNETSALGKAEWIKLFGVLFCKENEAEKLFNNIVSEYESVSEKVKNVSKKPTVFSGALYQNKWILPKGDSWGAQLIKDAGGEYLWANESGLGSLSLSFESVLEKAENADIWIGPGEFTSFDEMKKEHSGYAQFAAFKNKKIYSFSIKKGEKGGVLYYELAPNRPDLVLKDLAKICHPDLFKTHEFVFFQPLQ